MIARLVKEYEERYLKTFNDDFNGRVYKLLLDLKDPSLHQSQVAIDYVTNLAKSLKSPLKVGVIGQFSSGKSTLLNLVLGKNILPTGVIPVTFMPTFLKYHKDYLLGVKFDDKDEILVDASKLDSYTDQRKEGKNSKQISIYSPSDILKNITFVDTPGLNANEKDEKTTKAMLKDFHLIVWLSLAQNAGKKSEQDTLKSLDIPSKSICLINQKDKLTLDEQEVLKKHCDNVFGGIFNEILLISCKQKEQNIEGSGYDEFIKYLCSLDSDEIKKEYIKSRLKELKQDLKRQCEVIKTPYIDIKNIISLYEKTLLNDEVLNCIKSLEEKILIKLKEIANQITEFIQSKITTKQTKFYTQNTSLLHKNCFKEHCYEVSNLLVDNIYSDLFFNQDKFSRQFKKINHDLKNDFLKLKNLISSSTDKLSYDIDLITTKYSSFSKDNEFFSDNEFLSVRNFCYSLKSVILGDLLVEQNATFSSIDSFFDKLELKAFNNFMQATRLALSELYEKIEASKQFYEIDNANFSLYIPSTKDIYERLLVSFNFYEFEQMVEKSYLKKLYLELVSNLAQKVEQKHRFLDKKLEESTKQSLHFDTIFENVLKG